MQINKPQARSLSTYPSKKVVNANIELPSEYTLVEKVGQGSFGEIYKIYNKITNTLHACKVEFKDQKANNQQPLLAKEYKVFQALHGIRQVPVPYELIQTNEYNMIIMPFFGTGNLEELRKRYSSGKFTKHCVMRVAHSLISVIEAVHERKYVHRDIKPENFIVGSTGDHHIVYLIDYGLAKLYVDSQGQHIPMAENKGMVGTARYTSINSHIGLEQSRRDDIEAICYVLLYLYLGQLPWQNFNCTTRQEKFQKILDSKSRFASNQLDLPMPDELRQIYDYTRGLNFEQQPDYGMLKQLCLSGCNQQRPYCLDWCTPQCDYKPFEDHMHESDLNCEMQISTWKDKRTTVTEQISTQARRQNIFQQIIEEEEHDSIEELPHASQVPSFRLNSSG